MHYKGLPAGQSRHRTCCSFQKQCEWCRQRLTSASASMYAARTSDALVCPGADSRAPSGPTPRQRTPKRCLRLHARARRARLARLGRAAPEAFRSCQIDTRCADRHAVRYCSLPAHCSMQSAWRRRGWATPNFLCRTSWSSVSDRSRFRLVRHTMNAYSISASVS